MFKTIIDAIKYYKSSSDLERELWMEAKFFAEKENVIAFTTDSKRYHNSKRLLNENSGKNFILVEKINSKLTIDISPLIKYIPPERECLKKYIDMKKRKGESGLLYKIKIENIIDDVKFYNPVSEEIF